MSRNTATLSAHKHKNNGTNWIHTIITIHPMLKTTKKILTSILEDAPWELVTTAATSEEDTWQEEISENDCIMRQLRQGARST